MTGRDNGRESGIIEPGELLDADGNIDPAAVTSRKQSGVSASVCEALRLDAAGKKITAEEIAGELLPQFCRATIGKHLRGDCSHDVDTPPVRRVSRWEVVEDNG